MPALSNLGQVTLLFLGGISFTLLRIFLQNPPKKDDWPILLSLPLVWVAVILIFTTGGLSSSEESLVVKAISLLLAITAFAWLEKYKKQILPSYSPFLIAGLYLASFIYSLILFPSDLGRGALALLLACLIFYLFIYRSDIFFKHYLHFAILNVVVEIILFLSIWPQIEGILAKTVAFNFEKALTVFFTASYVPIPFLIFFYLITLSRWENEHLAAYEQRIKNEEDFQKGELLGAEKITASQLAFLFVVAGLQIILGLFFHQDPLLTYSIYLTLLYFANDVFSKKAPPS